MIKAIAAVCLGASCGALLRWRLGAALNAVWPGIPLGTLTANLLGGYLIGLAAGAFAAWPTFGAQWGLLLVTGFLGSLTTFSAFSLETASLIQQNQLMAAAAMIALHVGGSLLMTFAGLASFNLALRHLG